MSWQRQWLFPTNLLTRCADPFQLPLTMMAHGIRAHEKASWASMLVQYMLEAKNWISRSVQILNFRNWKTAHLFQWGEPGQPGVQVVDHRCDHLLGHHLRTPSTVFERDSMPTDIVSCIPGSRAMLFAACFVTGFAQQCPMFCDVQTKIHAIVVTLNDFFQTLQG